MEKVNTRKRRNISNSSNSLNTRIVFLAVNVAVASISCSTLLVEGFTPLAQHQSTCTTIFLARSHKVRHQHYSHGEDKRHEPFPTVAPSLPLFINNKHNNNGLSPSTMMGKIMSTIVSVLLVSVLALGGPAFAENELSDKYGGGLDTSLIDQTCLINQCSLQAKSCLQDDPSCRKGLTCTAKCLGDNACITGCMARYGNENLDNLLKCTIEDNECIKIAILPGGSDVFGEEPPAPVPVVQNFNVQSLQGSWYKVIGYNPNYDCYACQRNTFSPSTSGKSQHLPQLGMDVEFSMPHLLPDGSPPPPSSIRESLSFVSNDAQQLESSMKSIGLNDYHTHETMIFDQGNMNNKKSLLEQNINDILVLNKGTPNEQNYRRTAHSEGEMFGLKFWENWYIIGENDPGEQEFKFVYYNGKTRQNTYDGAFVYSRTKNLSPDSLKKVYQIALDAGMNPDQFCRIRNGCFADEPTTPGTKIQQESDFFRGILASTRVSELLGVEPVAASSTIRRNVPTAKELTPDLAEGKMNTKRAIWHEIGDYLENPHRHFQVMDDLRLPMDWPQDMLTANTIRLSSPLTTNSLSKK